MNQKQFYKLCEAHVEHARQKHPFFADKASGLKAKEHREMAKDCHALRKRMPHVSVILHGEVHEFAEALVRGDVEQAREEAADIVAVLWRALDGDIGPKEGCAE